jgi:hypothetical protein
MSPDLVLVSRLTRSDRLVSGYAAAHDATQRLRYGAQAPRVAELLWVRSTEVTHRLDESVDFAFSRSGRTVQSWPEDMVRPVFGDTRSSAMMRRFSERLSWDDSGYIDVVLGRIAAGIYDQGDRTLDDIRARCARLDALFERIGIEGRLRTQSELRSGAFRELGGVQISISPEGKPTKTGGGNHRLAIAAALGIDTIPAMLGVVHVSALERLTELRRSTPRGP